jgi:hypothetical protein
MGDTSVAIRSLTISLITGESNPILDWFIDLWDKLSIVETDVYHENGGEFIYYITENDGTKQFVFYQDNANAKFYCNSKTYWRELTSKFSLIYSEVQQVTKFLIDNAFGNIETKPQPNENYSEKLVTDSLQSTSIRRILFNRDVTNALDNLDKFVIQDCMDVMNYDWPVVGIALKEYEFKRKYGL